MASAQNESDNKVNELLFQKKKESHTSSKKKKKKKKKKICEMKKHERGRKF